jgi:ABC-2 type transport system ATP-binding protein
MIHHGELLIADTPSAVKAQMKGKILELRTENNQRSLRILEGAESLRGLVLSGDKIHILVDDSGEGERVVRDILETRGMSIQNLMVVRPSLEDAFVSMVKERGNKP